MEINNKLTVTRREGGGGLLGKSRGRVKSRNMYKGPMDKDNGTGRIECGRWRVGRAWRVMGGKWQQL